MDELINRQLPPPVEETSLDSFTGSVGRPSKLEDSRVDDLVKWLKLGYYIEDACTMAGIGKTTYYNWIAKAEANEGPEYVEFMNAVKKARAEAEGAHIMNIRKAADNGVWQASAWFLERSHPVKWGKRNPDLITEESDEPIEFDIKYADG
jgi:transposase